MSRISGTVKFFSSQKGYGFILPDSTSELSNSEVFVHHSVIFNNGGFKSLAEGEKVEFEVVSGPKGYQATKVTGPGGVAVRGDPRIGRHRMIPNYGLYNRGNYGMNAYGQPPMYAGNQMPVPNVQMGYGSYTQGSFPTDLSTPRSNMQPNRNATSTGGFTGQPGYNPTSLYGNGVTSGFVGNPLGNGNFAGQPANFNTGQRNPSFNGYDSSGFPSHGGNNAQFASAGTFGGSA